MQYRLRLLLFLLGNRNRICQHQLDPVFLIDPGGAGVIIDRHDVRFGVPLFVMDHKLYGLNSRIKQEILERFYHMLVKKQADVIDAIQSLFSL